MVSLDAGAVRRGPGFLVRETVRALSDVDLADAMKHKFRLLLMNSAMAFSDGECKTTPALATKRNQYDLSVCVAVNKIGNQSAKYDSSEGP